MMAYIYLFIIYLGIYESLSAQTVRYKEEIFTSHQVQSNIQYGQTSTHLLDIYTGTGDTLLKRPLVIFIHGGGFKDPNVGKVGAFQTRVCTSLARRGYVAASINYRLTSSIPNDTIHFEAMLRALQDAKAAVRFFRRFSDTYGIDTSQIFVTGSSAGSITALHMAYLDSTDVPSYVNWGRIGGTFEGTSGNPSYSSNIHGVISNWGAIGDTSWIEVNNVPVYLVHGTSDATVYYDQIPADGPFLYGSKFVYQRAQSVNVVSGLRVFNNTGHTLDNNATKQDSAIKDFSAWLFTIIKQEATSAPEGHNLFPTNQGLRSIYPNPFNPSTTLVYDLAGNEHVFLDVYDLLGRKVIGLVDKSQELGTYNVVFNASDLVSGIYICRFTVAKKSEYRRIILLR